MARSVVSGRGCKWLAPARQAGIKRFCDGAMELSRKLGEGPSSICEDNMVMIGHHTRSMDQHARLLGGPCKAVEDDLVCLVGRAKPKGALITTARQHARDEGADGSGVGHGRDDEQAACQR